MTGHDSAEILAIKDNQITDLRNPLETVEAQLQRARCVSCAVVAGALS